MMLFRNSLGAVLRVDVKLRNVVTALQIKKREGAGRAICAPHVLVPLANNALF